MWDSKPVTYYSQGTHNSVSQGECPVRKQKNPNRKLLNRASDWKVSADLKTSLQFPDSIIQTKKAARHSVVRFKEECPSHRIDCPLGRKLGGSTRVEEKQIWDTVCWLRGKGLDMLYDSYWDWSSWFSRTLSHFVFSKIEITGCSLKVASNRLQTMAQYASSWIWSKARSLQHEWNARGTTISVWLWNIKKLLQ